MTLCGCIPFNLPTNFPDFSLEMRLYQRCNLAHVKCLFRYKSKQNFVISRINTDLQNNNLRNISTYTAAINTIRPNLDHYSHVKGLEKEFGDSVSCPNCLPLCSQHNYRIQTTYAKFSSSYKEQPLGVM